jgi:hypothetical protein
VPGGTSLRFRLDVGATGRLTVVDPLGRVRYSQSVLGTGQAADVYWPDTGARDGAYFCRLNAGSVMTTQKFVLTKE